MVANTQDLGLIGKKVGMTQLFDDEGNIVPVTVIQLSENIVTEVRTQEKDGYWAVQVGADICSEKKLTKPERVSLEKKNLPLMRILKEFRCQDAIENVKVGDAINLEEFFKDLKKVSVVGNSIGKGFQGGTKLHNMGVGSRTHGSKSKRIIGSIGPGTTPGNVKKGKKMPSMMGNRTVTVQKAKVFRFDAEKKLLLVRGAVPGKTGNLLFVRAYAVRPWNEYNKASV